MLNLKTWQIHKQIIYPQYHGWTFELPACSNLLTAQIQSGKIVVWYEATGDVGSSEKYICYWTGLDISTEEEMFDKYVATVQDPNAGLVWHIFTQLDT